MSTLSNPPSSQYPSRTSGSATIPTADLSNPPVPLAGPSITPRTTISPRPSLQSTTLAYPDYQFRSHSYSSLEASSAFNRPSYEQPKAAPSVSTAWRPAYHEPIINPQSYRHHRRGDSSVNMMMSQRDLGYGYMPGPLHNPMHSYSNSQSYQTTLAPLPGYYSDSQHRSLSGSSRPSSLPLLDFPSFGSEERDEDLLSRKRRRTSQQQDARRQQKLRVRRNRLPSIVDLGGDGNQVLGGPVDVYSTAPSSSAYVHESIERPQLRPSLSPPFRNEYNDVLPGPPSSYVSQPFQPNYSLGPMNPPTLAPPHLPNANGGYPTAGRSSPLLQAPLPPGPAPSPHVEPVVLDRREKPQCWDHGCNGREFSTFSNLLRHQREKSGSAAKSYCPHCGAEFTRTTARNGHMEHGKCKTRRTSETSNRTTSQ